MDMQHEKLVIAVLQGDDYPEVVKALNDKGFYVTLLNSSGGFLKKRNMTVMIGLEEERLEEALTILKTHAGERAETTFHTGEMSMAATPVRVRKGGVTFFVVNVERGEKH